MTGSNTPFSCASFPKKGRMRWTPELHEAFVAAVEALGPEAYPISVLERMGPCGAGLTRENIASHLQKYRRRIFNNVLRSPKRSAAAAFPTDADDASLPLRRYSAPTFGDRTLLCLADGQPLLHAGHGRFATQSATAAEAASYAATGGAFGDLYNVADGDGLLGGAGDDCFLLPELLPEPLPDMPALEDLSCSNLDGSGFDGAAGMSGLTDDGSSWIAQQQLPASTASVVANVPLPFVMPSSPHTVTSPCYWTAASAAADMPKPACPSPATGFGAVAPVTEPSSVASPSDCVPGAVTWAPPQPPICIAPVQQSQAARYEQMHAALLKALAAPSSLPGQSPIGLKLDKQAVLQELRAASLVAA